MLEKWKSRAIAGSKQYGSGRQHLQSLQSHSARKVGMVSGRYPGREIHAPQQPGSNTRLRPWTAQVVARWILKAPRRPLPPEASHLSARRRDSFTAYHPRLCSTKPPPFTPPYISSHIVISHASVHLLSPAHQANPSSPTRRALRPSPRLAKTQKDSQVFR